MRSETSAVRASRRFAGSRSRRADSQPLTRSMKAASVFGSLPPSASPSACSARGSGSGNCANSSSTRWRSASADRRRADRWHGRRCLRRRPRHASPQRRSALRFRSPRRPRGPRRSGDSGRNSRRRQRERDGLRQFAARRVADEQQGARGGGSSSTFSKVFAPRRSVRRPSTMEMRQPPSPAVEPKNATLRADVFHAGFR